MADSDPKPDQTCETCNELGHCYCWPETGGPDVEHIPMMMHEAVRAA